LGALVSNSNVITYKMFLEASKKLSTLLTEEELAIGKLLPDLENIREISAQIGIAVAIEARNAGLGRIGTDEEIDRAVRKAQWNGKYRRYRYSKQ